MLRHRWKILIGIVVVLISLTAVELATIGTGPKEEVEAYKKSLIAKGEKLEISQLLPLPIPPEQNGADIVIEALNMLTSADYEESNSVPAMQMVAPGKAIVCFEQPEIRSENFTNSWSNAIAVVADDRPMTELLKQAVNYQAFDFYLNYKGDDVEEGRYFRPLVWSANRLSTGAMCDLYRGDAASAAKNICGILALVNGEKDMRRELFQQGRIRTTSVAANASWALLQSCHVNAIEFLNNEDDASRTAGTQR